MSAKREQVCELGSLTGGDGACMDTTEPRGVLPATASRSDETHVCYSRLHSL